MELDREEEARLAAKEALKASRRPQHFLKRWTRRSFYKDPAILERELEALRKAGVPE